MALIEKLLPGTIIQNGLICFPLPVLGLSESASAESIIAAIFLQVESYFNGFIEVSENDFLTTEDETPIEYKNEYSDVMMYCFWWKPYLAQRGDSLVVRRELILYFYYPDDTN